MRHAASARHRRRVCRREYQVDTQLPDSDMRAIPVLPRLAINPLPHRTGEGSGPKQTAKSQHPSTP
jgi:hypothetical protein